MPDELNDLLAALVEAVDELGQIVADMQEEVYNAAKTE